mmetsp:Transcript_24206/g.52206  ORF Transcript_24206/g.52206 Transcript_24206/m.52206 type:complete len:161 (-) Transcript_24206:559-1041(-)
MASTNALRGKITEYGNFISQTLQPQLQTAVDAREETEAEISEYVQLQNKLQQIEKTNNSRSDASINTIADISHGTIYCNATIPNPRIIYVNIGFGFHVEMTLPEAISFIDKRVDHLENNVLKPRLKVAATVAKDVENALEVLEEFGEKLMEMDGESKRNY